MATHRKTRQQKIQATQKRSDLVEPTIEMAAAASTVSASTYDEHAEYAYVSQDLKRIAVISLICFIILIIATILLSEFSWFGHIRQTLHIPTFTIR